MKVKDWQEKYVVNCQDNFHYFGEVGYDGKELIACGTGLYYYTNDSSFKFMENHNPDTYNGMYFQRSPSDDYGHYFEAGFSTNGRLVGPHLFFKKTNKPAYYNEKFELIYSELNENSKEDGPSIAIFPNNTFSIIKYINGEPLNLRIRFEYGKLFLEKSGEDKPLDSLDCGWGFEPFYVDICPDFCSGFSGRGIKPASTGVEKIKGESTHLYYGALLTYGLEQNYHFENGRHVFENEVYKYGIVELSSGKYFGEIKANGNKGDYYRHGFGCFKNNFECYLGYHKFNERSYFGLLKREKSTFFAQFENNQMDGLVFERRKDKLIIATYKKGKRVNDYFEIDNQTFDVLKKDERGNIKAKASFSNPKDKEENIKKEDKISPNIIKVLNNYNLAYEILDNLDIYVTGSTLPKEKVNNLFIPNCVNGIKSGAFKSYNNLKEVTILDGITHIGDGAFEDCENIEKVRLPSTIEEIGAYTFTSKRLEVIEIPFHVGLIKNYAFSECKNLKLAKIENQGCVIEKYAFPKHMDYLNDKNTSEVKEKTNKGNDKNGKDKVEKPKIKKKRKVKAEDVKEKTKDVFIRIGEFFTKDIVKFFKLVGEFFVAIFGIIKEFFVETIPNLFKGKSKEKKYRSKSYRKSSYRSKGSSFFGAIGSFFAMIGKGIWIGICAPFKLIKSMFSGDGSLLFVGAIIMGVYVILAATKAIVFIEWDVSWYVPRNSFFGYRWELVLWGVSILKIGGFFSLIFGLLITVAGAIIDFILYAILGLIIYFIPHAIQIIIQLVIVFVIPACIPIGCIVLLAKGESKGGALVPLLISIGLAVLYFIFLTPLLR